MTDNTLLEMFGLVFVGLLLWYGFGAALGWLKELFDDYVTHRIRRVYYSMDDHLLERIDELERECREQIARQNAAISKLQQTQPDIENVIRGVYVKFCGQCPYRKGEQP